MPARRRAVPAAGTGEVAITPVSWEAYRIAGAEHDGPAPRWDGDGFQQRARQRDRRSVHVEHDALVGDPNDAVPRAAAQPAIYVTLETSPLQLVGDCPMFRLWYRRPEDSPPRRRSQVSSARYTATVTLEATPVRAQSAAPRSGPLGRCANGLGRAADGLGLRRPEPGIGGVHLLSTNRQGHIRSAEAPRVERRVH